MFTQLRKRAFKAGQPPGTLVYTGDKTIKTPTIHMIHYDGDSVHKTSGDQINIDELSAYSSGVTWVNVQGLQQVDSIKQLAEYYKLHPLTVEDILNNDQRTKVEEFDHYLFITLKMLTWKSKVNHFHVEEFSIVIGKNYVLTFQDCETTIFDGINSKLNSLNKQRLREQGSDYLSYRLIDTIVDQYFVVLERLGEEIEQVEEDIVTFPKPALAKTIYKLKRQMLMLRKAIWPMREVLSHLLQISQNTISSTTHVYLRDVYDHVVQAIDTLETFRDMLSGMLDIYLSSLTARMNEVMKVLTVIATIFIPITFIASIFGMNFVYMPELHWHYGYFMALGMMFMVVVGMLLYFRQKKWL